MGVVQYQDPIQFAQQEVNRYREDVEALKFPHESLNTLLDRWIWEKLVAKANFLFADLMDLDESIQEAAFTGQYTEEQLRNLDTRRLFTEWLDVSRAFLVNVDRLEQFPTEVKGSGQFRLNLKQAEAMLTPDDQYFNSDHLAKLRDQAIDAHRQGQTEALIDHVP